MPSGLQATKALIANQSLSGLNTLLVPLPAIFARILIEITWRYATNTVGTNVAMTFGYNGAIDSSGSYANQFITTQGTTAPVGGLSAIGGSSFSAGLPALSTSTAGYMSSSLIDFLNPANFYKNVEMTEINPSVSRIVQRRGQWQQLAKADRFALTAGDTWNADSWIRVLGER